MLLERLNGEANAPIVQFARSVAPKAFHGMICLPSGIKGTELSCATFARESASINEPSSTNQGVSAAYVTK